MTRALVVLAAVAAAVLGLGGGGQAATPMQAGQIVLEAPTVHSLGVRWYLSGDTEERASVRVEYRRHGERTWRQGLPLLRVGTGPDSQAGETRLETQGDRGWPFPLGNFFAGSVVDLAPNTSYDLRLTLARGAETVVRERTARTKAIPIPPKPRRTRHVVPGEGGGDGTKTTPFRGLAAADAAARPGDLFLVHAGVYAATFTITRSGAAGAPIVWRGAGDGESVIDGTGKGENGARAGRGVSANEVRFVFFQRISIRHTDFAFVAHNASDLTIQRCHFHENEFGFAADRHDPVQRNFYLSDNVFEGPSTWPRTKGIEEARAVQLCGEGHDVCYNRIRGFADGVDIMGPGPNRGIDFYNNEISECTDDAIELDYGQTNVRAFRNHITNCFEGISTQPLFGGPAYIFRNAMYNLEYTPFKMHNRPSGLIDYHNTIVKTGQAWPLWTSERVGTLISRNNLFVGTEANHVMEFTCPVTRRDSDYDGFAMGPVTEFASLNSTRFVTFDDFRARSGIEAHATWLGPTVPFASGVKPPVDHKVQFPLTVNDLRLARSSRAIDAGTPLPGFNDGYRGKAPDLGAYEYGEARPHYGPR